MSFHAMPSPLGIIANPRAAAGRRTRNRLKLEGHLRPGDQLVWTQDEAQLADTLKRFHEDKIAALGIFGGDGTIGLTLTAALKVWREDELPPVLLLRGGTMNVIAKSYGLKSRPETLLRRFLHDSKSSLKKDVLHQLCVGELRGCLFGCGNFIPFLDDYYAKPRPTPARAFKLVCRTILSALVSGSYAKKIFHRLEAQVQLDGQAQSKNHYSMISIATVRHIGLGFHPFFYAQKSPYKAHTLLTTCGPMGIAKNIGDFRAGRPSSPGQGIEHFAVNEITLHTDQPLRFALDGELHSATTPLKIVLGPQIPLLTL